MTDATPATIPRLPTDPDGLYRPGIDRDNPTFVQEVGSFSGKHGSASRTDRGPSTDQIIRPTGLCPRATDRPDLQPTRRGAGLTVLVPAYNEAASIADTVRSILGQTRPVDQVIVIDDCSSDGTADAARRAGATVIRPPRNTGSKAGAQNFGLKEVRTELCMAIDADTTLAPDAVEKILAVMEGTTVAAACGFVLPCHVHTVWERGRYVEYLFAFTFFKQIQDYYEKPLISSGCFSVYRTDVLRHLGGWALRTMAEDMDLTWTLYENGYRVRFVPKAVCYPIEPHDLHFMRCQLRRWSHGFIQNVRLHWRSLLRVPFLGSAVAIAMWDGVVASLAYLLLLPLLAILVNPLFLLGYVIDLPAVALPVIIGAARRGELRCGLASLPGFLVLRVLNSWFMLKAVWSEGILRRSLTTYEKGH